MAAPVQLIACPKCKAVLGAELFNSPDLQPCPSCETPLQVDAFPALFRQDTAVQLERIIAEGEASCFYHADKKAVVVCDACGRFLCALCDVDFDGQHLCPTCLETGRQKGKIKKLENRRTRHDKIALTIALVPMVTVWLTLISAPAALYYAIRHWKSPTSIAPHKPKLTLSIAIALASLQILGWVIFFVFLYSREKS
jgi:hypothetical protein